MLNYTYNLSKLFLNASLNFLGINYIIKQGDNDINCMNP